MDRVWEAIEESGLPVSHHIGETPPASPCEDNSVGIGMLHNVAPFREMFGKLRLRRDPRPPPRPAASAGSRAASTGCRRPSRTPSTSYASLQHMADHEIAARPAALLGQPHVRVVHGRPARPRADRPHRRRPGDVVDRLPAQREHLRLQQQSLASVVDAVGPDDAVEDRQQQRQDASSGSTADAGRAHGLGAAGSASRRTPDLPRMRRERAERVRASMARQGHRRARSSSATRNVVVRHRGDLAAGRLRPGQLRAAGRASSSPTTSCRTCSRRSAPTTGCGLGARRRPPARSRLPRLRRGRRGVRRRSWPTSCRHGAVDRRRRVDPRPAPGAIAAVRRTGRRRRRAR